MNFSKILSIVGNDYESSLRLVKRIKQFLTNAEYESISKREEQSLPSVYLQFDGIRPLVFDLRKSNSAQVFFWMKEHLHKEDREKYEMIPHNHTGWLGMVIQGSNELEYKKQLQVIVDYWDKCLSAISRGEHQSTYKRQALIMAMALHAFKDYSVITDRKSVPGFTGRPDIYIPELDVVIEIDGKQHYEFVKYFHRNRGGFLGQQKGDKILKNACKDNNVTLIRIVEDAADFIDSPLYLKELVEKARELSIPCYLIRKENSIKLINEEEFVNLRCK